MYRCNQQSKIVRIYINPSALSEHSNPTFRRLHLLGSVGAFDRLVLLECHGVEAKAVFGTSRVGHAVEPDRVAAIRRTRASLEANLLVGLVLEHQEAFLVDGEALTLSVLDGLLGTGGVLDDALAHSAPVDEELLGRVVGEEVESAVAELELGVVWGFGAAEVALCRGLDVQAVVEGLKLGVLEVGA
jgi:hypothetical protein